MKRFSCAIVVVLLFSLFAVDTADARPRRQRARWRPFQRRNQVSRNVSRDPGVSFAGGPQAVAEAKASRAASRGIKGHLGGSFGGANAEGVGWSTYSAQDALNNCCFTGRRTVAGQSVVRGNDGFYACKLFW